MQTSSATSIPTQTPTVAHRNNRWAEAYDELRGRQSLASVVNDPRSRLRPPDGIGDLLDKLRQHAEDIGTQRDEEAAVNADALVQSRTDQLVGPLPDIADFKPYLDALTDLWDVYHRNHRVRQVRPLAGQSQRLGSTAPPPQNGIPESKDTGAASLDGFAGDACDAHHSVPHEYFSGDFKLEHHQVFRQSLQTSVERQEELNAELTGHLDLIEVSLFEHIRRAQRDQLFDSLTRLGEPLQQDLRSALSVVVGLRSNLRSVQRKQLRYSMAVGRLARRKQRVAEVLQRLDCLAHVVDSQPSVQMLLQGQDYATALELLESTKAAMDTNLKGLVCARASGARLSSLASTFDRAVEADFVHQSAEAILPSTPEAALRNVDGLRRLCMCLARRDLLRSAVGSTLRDVLLAQLKKALKNNARTMLEELSATAALADGEASALPDEDGADVAVVPAGSPRIDGAYPEDAAAGGTEEQATVGSSESSAPRSSAAISGDAAAGISTALTSLTYDNFFIFWKRMMQDCVNVAERFVDYAVLIQETATSAGDECEPASSSSSSAPAGLGSLGAIGRSSTGVEASGELLRLFEVIMNSLLQKVGVLLQARHGDQRRSQCCPKLGDWQRFLKMTNEALDKVKSLQERCKKNLSPPEPCAVVDVRASMRTILYMQTKNVIEVFHEQRLAQAEAALRSEKWDRTDVPVQYKQLLEKLVGLEDTQLEPAALSSETSTAEQGTDRFLRVESVNYLVVPAVLTLVQLLTEYLQLCRDFENLGAEIVQRMVILLRKFNTETKSLVLGGEAVRRQTVKTIMAANLALCSQTCGLVAQVLPKLQITLITMLQGSASGQGSQVSGGGAMSRAVTALAQDLTGVAGEYADHRGALLGKLSDLLRDRYEQTAKNWLRLPHPEVKVDLGSWFAGGGSSASNGDANANVADDVDLCPHEALDGLVKGVTAMYKVLLKNLNGESVRRIFAKAFEEIAMKFEQRLQQELAAPSPPYEDRVGRSLGDRLVMDVAYLRDQLGKLSGITAPLQRLLQDLVHHLRVRLPTDDPLKAMHPVVLEVLQRTGRLPMPQ